MCISRTGVLYLILVPYRIFG